MNISLQFLLSTSLDGSESMHQFTPRTIEDWQHLLHIVHSLLNNGGLSLQDKG
jgi:hypothetical protein